MADLVFSNRKNTYITMPDGTVHWLSRACAVMAVVEIINPSNGERYVALGRRGPGTPDEQGKLGLPCGYLDWDESAFDGIRREIWEEMGLDVHDEHEWGYEPEPWSVQSEPTANRQNVTLRFAFSRNAHEFPTLSAENCEPDEVSELLWIPCMEAMNLDLAFNHQEVLKLYYKDRLKFRHSDLFNESMEKK